MLGRSSLGIICATFGRYLFTGSGHVTEQWSHTSKNPRPIFTEIAFSATQLAAIDWNGDITRDLGQSMAKESLADWRPPRRNNNDNNPIEAAIKMNPFHKSTTAEKIDKILLPESSWAHKEAIHCGPFQKEITIKMFSTIIERTAPYWKLVTGGSKLQSKNVVWCESWTHHAISGPSKIKVGPSRHFMVL